VTDVDARAVLHARLSWSAAALSLFDLQAVVEFAERLAERDGHPAVPGRTNVKESER
jgi:hypothetical protein